MLYLILIFFEKYHYDQSVVIWYMEIDNLSYIFLIICRQFIHIYTHLHNLCKYTYMHIYIYADKNYDKFFYS